MPEALDTNTPIRIGALLTIAGLLVSAIWWAATLSTKVDAILNLSNGTAARVSVTENRISDQETRIRILEERHKGASN